MVDLQATLRERGHPACTSVIREAIKKAGYRWRSAKVVLTSNDPDYREKLDRVHRILRDLGKNERFFSIDEFGSFAIKAKRGRVLAEPGSSPSVPQWQKSKGWLIVTAALELSTNQVTHFYSRSKNTQEMIRMAQALLDEYKEIDILYLSWDSNAGSGPSGCPGVGLRWWRPHQALSRAFEPLADAGWPPPLASPVWFRRATQTYKGAMFGGGVCCGLTANKGSNWLASRAIKRSIPGSDAPYTCHICRCAMRCGRSKPDRARRAITAAAIPDE
jgi:hypothetical protein